jgi:hypothetical protein
MKVISFVSSSSTKAKEKFVYR